MNMKAQILLLCFSLLYFNSCDFLGEIQENDGYEYITKSQLYLGDLTLFANKSTIDNFIGKPDSSYHGFLYYDQLSIFVTNEDSLIWEINSTNPNYSTPDGISIGDARDKIIRTYGETVSWKNDSLETLSYQHYHSFQQNPLYLIFNLKEDTVKEISIWWHYE